MVEVRPHALFRRAEGVEVREVDDELFLTLPKQGTIHHLNATAKAAWHALAAPRSAAELTALFVQAFPGTPQRKIASDIGKLLRFFARNKLIVPAGTDVQPPPKPKRPKQGRTA